MLIGLTIVAFGTSMPEFAVSVKSIFAGSGDIVLGNVIGSNILNILLILGCSAVVHSLTVKNNTVKKELPITMLITTLFAVLLSDHIFDKSLKNSFTRSDGIVILLFFTVFIYYLIAMSRNKIEDEKEKNILPLSKSIIYTIIGIIGVVLGSNFVVDSAITIAKTMGVSERLISLTIIALGTSLPELVTSVTATRKGEYDIAIGNVVGSNIFNIGIVIGVPIAIFGGIGTISFSYIDLVVMVIASILLFMFSFNDYKITKREGILFLLLFITYYSYVLVS
jgi:cation:H+ antiporter